MKQLSLETQKAKLINRIVRNSELFDVNELLKKNLRELEQIQSESLIKLRIRQAFKSRTRNHIHIQYS